MDRPSRDDEVKLGRPTIYTRELADEILGRMADGETIRGMCEDSPHIPGRRTIYDWVSRDEDGFAKRFERARQWQAEALADDAVWEADQATDRDTAAAARVKFDARRWLAGKMFPRRYGDRVTQEHSGPDGGPIVVQGGGISGLLAAALKGGETVPGNGDAQPE